MWELPEISRSEIRSTANGVVLPFIFRISILRIELAWQPRLCLGELLRWRNLIARVLLSSYDGIPNGIVLLFKISRVQSTVESSYFAPEAGGLRSGFSGAARFCRSGMWCGSGGIVGIAADCGF
jgi:hypothetical protein